MHQRYGEYEPMKLYFRGRGSDIRIPPVVHVLELVLSPHVQGRVQVDVYVLVLVLILV